MKKFALCIAVAVALSTGYSYGVAPTYSHVVYATNSVNEWLNLYIAPSANKTPVYIWGHSNESTANGIKREIYDDCMTNEISVVSWESAPNLKTEAQFRICTNDCNLVFDWVLAHAKQYNFDTNRIFFGGQSRGSGICWPLCQQRWREVRGIYYGDGLPNGFWGGLLDVTGFIHTNSPPVFLTYSRNLPTDNQHNPTNGITVANRYAELGIGNRAHVEYGLDDRGVDRWYWLVSFIKNTDFAGGKPGDAPLVNSLPPAPTNRVPVEASE